MKLIKQEIKKFVNEEYIESIYNVYADGLIGVLKVLSHEDNILKIETDHNGNPDVLIAIAEGLKELI